MTELTPELVGKGVELPFLETKGETKRKVKLVMCISHPKGRCYIFQRYYRKCPGVKKDITEGAFKAIRAFVAFCKEEKP